MDLKIECKSITVDHMRSNMIAELINVPNYEIEYIVNQIGYSNLVENIDIDKILHEIGIDKCKEYFDLIDNVEED